MTIDDKGPRQASRNKIRITIHRKCLSGADKKKLNAKPDPISQLIRLLARQAAEEHKKAEARKRRRKIQKMVREAIKDKKSE